MSARASRASRGRFEAFIDAVERVGNRLPHPFWLFVSLCVIVIVLSVVLAKLGVSVEYLQASRDGARAPEQTTVAVKSLFDRDAASHLFSNLTTIYSGFPPLSLVMVMMLGVGFLEKTGMLSALIKKTIAGVKPSWIIAAVALVGVNGNLASDAGVIVVPTVAGAVFRSMGKNPWIGIIAGYVSVNGGFSANVLIAGTDVLLSGITASVTKGLGITTPIHPMINWYFMSASTLIIVGGTVLVTELFTKKRLGEALPGQLAEDPGDQAGVEQLRCTPAEVRGLRWCGVVVLIYVALVVLALLPSSSFLRAADGTLLPKSPLLQSIVTLLLLMFLLLGLTYGKVTRSLTSMGDVPKMMANGLEGALGFMVIALPASVFIDLFDRSNISLVVGVGAGDLLSELQVGRLTMLLLFIVVCTLTNLFMTGNSAKWLIMAPIFVPMLSRLGISPAGVQATYRIGDTCTNIISPIDYYVPVIMGLLAMYRPKDKKVGLGTVISLGLPYSLVFMAGLVALLCLWYALGLPLGPGAPFFL